MSYAWSIGSLTAADSTLFFQLDSVTGYDSDGWWQPSATPAEPLRITPTGLSVASDYDPWLGGVRARLGNTAVIGSKLFFIGADGQHGTQVWRSNDPPTAAVAGPTSAVTGQTLAFTLSATDSHQDPITGYKVDWDGAGPLNPVPVSGSTLTRLFADPGSHTFFVGATDVFGALAWTPHTVTVNPMSTASLGAALP